MIERHVSTPSSNSVSLPNTTESVLSGSFYNPITYMYTKNPDLFYLFLGLRVYMVYLVYFVFVFVYFVGVSCVFMLPPIFYT